MSILNFFHHYPTNFELLFLTGAKIISSKAFCSLNFRTTSRNLSGELWINPNFSYQSGYAIQGNETSVFPNALLLSHRDSMMSKAHYKVHVWNAFCILLGSAMSLVSCFVNRIRKMVSFELDKDTEKGVFSFQWAMLTLESLWHSSSIGAWNPNVWGSIPHGNSEFFLCPMLVTRPKIILLYC